MVQNKKQQFRQLDVELENIDEYLNALKGSEKYGPQVVCHRTSDGAMPKLVSIPDILHPKLNNYLHSISIESLYSHQKEAIDRIGEGQDVLVSTPTASGKSMVYNLPVLNSLVTLKQGYALYLFPLKALAQDQLKKLHEIAAHLCGKQKQDIAAIYDGDTSQYQRKKIKENPPSILITNPDMLHLSILPYHQSWIQFFKGLQFIVIDEVHTYRGVFGSHMSWVLKRLGRLAAHYGAEPRFILSSATVGNPDELGANLLGKKVTVIDKTGAPQARKHMLFLNPWDSAAHVASQLLEAAIKRKLRTIVYTQSRKLTELISMWTKPKLGEFSDKLSSYRAGFTPEERREIEAKLSNGDLYGVISTSALELGIDIGDLDLCILVGYPGSIMAAWQRGGRVGRGQQESAVVLIGQEDALDQYFMKNPDSFFTRKVEAAVLNPFNSAIVEKHLHCAAAELPIEKDETILQDSPVKKGLEKLLHNGVLLQAADGATYFPTRKYPQRQVSLRGSGNQLTIINGSTGQLLGEIDAGKAMKECHEGAVYLHRSQTWYVDKLDLLGGEVVVVEGPKSFYTKPTSSKQTEILDHQKSKKCFSGIINFGEVKVIERITGYQKIHSSTRKIINTYGLDLPEQIIETEGIWLIIPEDIKVEMEKEQYHFMGAIHALEHVMISLYPLFVLCDRNDIGGISCPIHEQTEMPTIFVYDGHDGGIGLCKEAYDKIESILKECRTVVAECECENGCPSCVHSPKCGSGNRPIDKNACLHLLDELLKESQGTRHISEKLPAVIVSKNTVHHPEGLMALPEHYCVFDLETKYSAEEVGGWQFADRMGLSVGVVYDSVLDGYVSYLEREVEDLINHLESCPLVIGFNNKRFDNQVLSGYSQKPLNTLPTLDILEEISNYLGYRLSLDRVAQATLNIQKSGDGLQALQWYKEGEIGKIQKYCKKDVLITKDLFLFGLEEGYFLFTNKAGNLVRLPLQFDKTIARILG